MVLFPIAAEPGQNPLIIRLPRGSRQTLVRRNVKVSFESGRKGGSGLCLGERDFDLNVSTKTQWQQKEKIANSYDSCDGLMTMAASVVVLVAYSNCGQWQRTAAALCSQGTDGWQTIHMEQANREQM